MSQNTILEKLNFVYGPERGPQIFERVQTLLSRYAHLKARQTTLSPHERLTERDALLITYGDQVQGGSGSHLQTLHAFLNAHLKGVMSGVHILPFYPYTSDDGFSVVDYKQVDPALGTWADVEAIHTDFRIMFDAVINHISAESTWFKGFINGEAKYQDYFIVTDPQTDLSSVTRPRALPLLTPIETAVGLEHVWTTFSADQIDLNYANPDVLLDVLYVLLFYVEKGADLIRLDAIGYLWKQVGTSSIHLPQTHAVVQLMRAVLDEVAPNTIIITETNVPHKDNISYFGDGSNEAQLVYQFPLVPLVLNAFYSGNARHLRDWASTLELPSDRVTFFNFLASHDGIGVVPAKSILSEAEVQQLVDKTLEHGGQVSYKNNSDGSQSPYELNITYFDALSNPNDNDEPLEVKINRFMAAQAILISLQGLPGIYFHSLLGSPNDLTGLAHTGRNRSINRQKLQAGELEQALSDKTSRTAQVFARYTELLKLRTRQPAFHPYAPQRIFGLNDALFSFGRTSLDGQQKVLVVVNVSPQPQSFDLPTDFLSGPAHDLISGQTYVANQSIEVPAYGVLWLVG